MRLRDVATKMGVTLGYVSRVWGDEDEKISLASIEKFCEALNIDPVTIDLYVEKMLPYLARESDSLRDAGRRILERKGRPKAQPALGPRYLR